MKQIAIIGAGQLGSRHLQGLAQLPSAYRIDVSDPSESSRATAQERFDAIRTDDSPRLVQYSSTMDALPRRLDYVIVATNADVRLGVLRELLGRCSVEYALLEKVLFQCLEHYAEAQELIGTHGVRAWVNCSRRAYPIYAEVKDFFANDPVRRFAVSGRDWGIGSNSVHFLDLLGMVTGRTPCAVSTAGLDQELAPGKRPNTVEFTGSLRGAYEGGAVFDLSSTSTATSLVVEFEATSRSCVVDETGGTALFVDHSASDERRVRFTAPMASQMAAPIASQVLADGQCQLPRFEESVRFHVPLIEALSAHASAAAGSASTCCPIT